MFGDLLRFVYFICQIGLLPFNNTKEAQDAVVKFAIGISRGAMYTLLPYMAELTERLLSDYWGLSGGRHCRYWVLVCDTSTPNYVRAAR